MVISLIALVISLIALIYTVRTYLLKSGNNIRGSFGTCSSIACEDKYISNIVLENTKDKSSVIFAIYLKISNNNYLEIENFKENPLILKPFEVYSKEYDPIEFYSVSDSRIKIDKLIDNKKVKKQLILSTTDGMYKVSSRVEKWSPISTFFNNYSTAIIRIRRSMYKDRGYGQNVKYIVELKIDADQEEIIPIYANDYERKIFSKFSLTEESLQSKDKFEIFLLDKKEKNILQCSSVSVKDLDSWRKENFKFYNKDIFEAKNLGWIKYYVGGRLYTLFSNYKLKRKNSALAKKA